MNILHKIRAISIYLLTTLAITVRIYGQQNIIHIGEIFTIHSEVLQEDREILISLPNEYSEDVNIKYPVIYLLDGSTHLRFTSGIVKFLSDIKKIPPMIVVGICNVDRMRDFTPPITSKSHGHHHDFPSSGGAEDFLTFISDELVPHVHTNYRADTLNILAGHSVGGLFTVHCLLNRKDLFAAYIAVSPSLWWNDSEVLKMATQCFEDAKRFNTKLYLTYGGVDGAKISPSCINFVKILRKKAPDNLKWKSKCLPDEEHRSTPLLSIYHGLEFIFSDWTPPASQERSEEKYKY